MVLDFKKPSTMVMGIEPVVETSDVAVDKIPYRRNSAGRFSGSQRCHPRTRSPSFSPIIFQKLGSFFGNILDVTSTRFQLRKLSFDFTFEGSFTT